VFASAVSARSAPFDGVPLLDRQDLAAKIELEGRHWWYRGRREVVHAALTRLDLPQPCELLDAGCGSGTNLEWLSSLGPARGVDLNPAAIEWAASRGHDVAVGSLNQLDYRRQSFDLITCLDVLEHIEDDAGALLELRRVTRHGGHLLVTAPAYPRLRSEHDAAAGHVRRYTRPRLVRLAEANGWEPVLVTSFNFLLLPAAAARRLATRPRRQSRRPRSDLLRGPAALDSPLSLPLRLEAAALRRGVRLAWGLSILVALRKR